jgi:GcrA cell cycle regulator
MSGQKARSRISSQLNKGAGEVTQPWTDDRVLSLRLFWAQGLSASQIARQIGGTTRNAVIGKIHRLGIQTHAPTRTINLGPAKSRRALARRNTAPRRSQKAQPLPTPAPDPLPPLNVTLDDRKRFQCAAVVDSTRFEQRYCGHVVKGGSSYCEGHDAMFFILQDRKGKAA